MVNVQTTKKFGEQAKLLSWFFIPAPDESTEESRGREDIEKGSWLRDSPDLLDPRPLRRVISAPLDSSAPS